jgi:hypothetical protein
LSWSELFRTQHRVHQINQQCRAHRQRYDRIEHFPYLNPSQNFTYRTDNPKNINVEMEKIVSSIAVLPSQLAEHHNPQSRPARCSPCGNSPHWNFNASARILLAGGVITKFLPSCMKRNNGEAALGRMRNRVRHDDHFCPVASPKVRRVLPIIVLWVLWVVLLFPEIRQNIKKKNDARTIQHNENCDGHWITLRRRLSSSRIWHPFRHLPISSLTAATSSSRVLMPFVLVHRHTALSALSRFAG